MLTRTSLFFVLFALVYTSGLVHAQPSTTRVGLIAPLSGEFASYGVGAAQAMELANDQTAGPKITLVKEDNRTCQSGDAITAFHKLVNVDKVDVVVTFCTAAAQGVLPLTIQRKIPLIQLTESGVDPSNYMLKMMPEALPFAKQLAKDLRKKYTTIALVGNEMEVNTGPRGNLPVFSETFTRLGGKIVLTETFPDTETDFKSLVLRIRSSGAEAVSPFIWQPQQMAAFMKEADRMKLWKSVPLAGNYAFEFMFSQILSVYPRLSSLEGLESINFVEHSSPEFRADYKKRFNSDPPQFADYSYDVMAIVKECRKDAACYRKPRQGVTGAIAFGDDGRRVGRFASKRLVKGKFEVVSAPIFSNAIDVP
jgi:branched-chain amino acid transport system substrate-binding protein